MLASCSACTSKMHCAAYTASILDLQSWDERMTRAAAVPTGRGRTFRIRRASREPDDSLSRARSTAKPLSALLASGALSAPASSAPLCSATASAVAKHRCACEAQHPSAVRASRRGAPDWSTVRSILRRLCIPHCRSGHLQMLVFTRAATTNRCCSQGLA